MIVISCFLPGKTYSAQEATWAFRDGSQSVRTARCRSRGLPCFRIMSTSVNVNSIKFMIFHANVANISVKLSQWASPFIYIIAFDVWMICVLAGVEECHNALRQELGIVRQEARGPIQRSNFNTFNIFIYFLHSWFFSEAPIFFQVSLQSLLYTLFIQLFSPQSSTLYSLRSSLHNSPCLFPSFVSLHHILLQTIFKLLSGLSSQFFSTLFIQQTTGQQNGCRASCLWGSTQTSSSAAGRTESTLSYIIYIWLWFWRLGNDCRCFSGGSGLRWFNDV